jgi:hypothetical protein
MEKVETLKLQVIPKLVIPIELPKDPEGNGNETITLEFEVKRQTPKNASEVVEKSKELTDSYHKGEINDMEYSEKMLGLLCEKTYWHILKKYDLLYVKKIMDHIQK